MSYAIPTVTVLDKSLSAPLLNEQFMNNYKYEKSFNSVSSLDGADQFLITLKNEHGISGLRNVKGFLGPTTYSGHSSDNLCTV